MPTPDEREILAEKLLRGQGNTAKWTMLAYDTDAKKRNDHRVAMTRVLTPEEIDSIQDDQHNAREEQRDEDGEVMLQTKDPAPALDEALAWEITRLGNFNDNAEIRIQEASNGKGGQTVTLAISNITRQEALEFGKEFGLHIKDISPRLTSPRISKPDQPDQGCRLH